MSELTIEQMMESMTLSASEIVRLSKPGAELHPKPYQGSLKDDCEAVMKQQEGK